MNRTIAISYALAALAILGWAAVIYAGFSVEASAANHAQALASAQRASDQLAYADRIHALATETAAQRVALESLTSTDIVTIVSLLESTGASVSAKVSTALPEGSPTPLQGGGQIQAVSFVVNAAGTFSSLMQALARYEHLPVPSAIEQADIERLETATSPAAPWRMTIHVKILTSAVVSS